MTRSIYLSIVFLFHGLTMGLAQNRSTDIPVVIVEEMPQYPGGDKALLEYLSKNLTYPAEARKKGIMGVVFVGYTVDINGNAVDVKIVMSSNELFNPSAFEVVQSISGYKPGTQDGKPVPVRFTIPIQFTLNDGTTEWEENIKRKLAFEFYNLGIKQNENGNFDMANHLFSRALTSQPQDFPECFIARGSVRMALKDYSGARNDFTSALEINQTKGEVYFNRGMANARLRDMDAACADWLIAKELGYEDAIPLVDSQCSGK